MTDNFTPEQAQRELNDLLVKSGRRCAYDLRHAADLIVDGEMSKMFYERSQYWLGIFNPGNDQKNYRHRLYNTIEELELRIAKLQERCEDNGINIDDLKDDFPF